jgi:predicted permease
VGVLLAFVGLRAFVRLSPSALPRSTALTVDLRILGFAILIAAATALLFGLLPALRLAGRDVAGVLGSRARGSTDGRGAQRARSALVVAEVALSLILVTQAGLLLRSFAHLHDQPLGFRTDGIWTLPMTPREIANPEEWNRRMESVRASLASVPGVQGATFGLSMPLEFTGGSRCCWSGGLQVPGGEGVRRTFFHPVDADYLTLFEQQFIAGSGWTRTDEATEPGPIVITEPLAIVAFGSASDALGREVIVDSRSRRVTGVVADNRHYGPDQEHGPAAYIPASSLTYAPGRVHMAVQVGVARDGLVRQLREAVWRVEPNLPVPIVQPMSGWAQASTARTKFESVTFSVFGAVTLLLVAGGLYGTLLYTVGQRRRELGIRLALGDAPARVEGRFVSQGVTMALLGCIAGAAGAWGFGRLLQSRLFGVQAGDPLTLAAGITILLLVALFASWLPARRAAGTDPMEALRTE